MFSPRGAANIPQGRAPNTMASSPRRDNKYMRPKAQAAILVADSWCSKPGAGMCNAPKTPQAKGGNDKIHTGARLRNEILPHTCPIARRPLGNFPTHLIQPNHCGEPDLTKANRPTLRCDPLPLRTSHEDSKGRTTMSVGKAQRTYNNNTHTKANNATRAKGCKRVHNTPNKG